MFSYSLLKSSYCLEKYLKERTVFRKSKMYIKIFFKYNLIILMAKYYIERH